MSAKKLVTEWRNFLKETSDFDSDPMMSPEELEYEEGPVDRDHSEGSKQIHGFFDEIGADISSQEAMDFFAACERPENAEACVTLSEICMNFEQKPDLLIRLLEKSDFLKRFLAAAAQEPQNSDPVDFDEEM